MWASSVISPPESSTVAAAAHATDNTPVVEPPYPLPIRPATAPASENPDPLPATVSTRSTLPCPVGSHWPVWCVALAVRLVTAVKLSLRSTPRVLETVFGFLLGRTTKAAVMVWTTVRCWLMRLGLYALLRPLKEADDWAYLIDHTVQIGEVKCFAVVGVQAAQTRRLAMADDSHDRPRPRKLVVAGAWLLPPVTYWPSVAKPTRPKCRSRRSPRSPLPREPRAPPGVSLADRLNRDDLLRARYLRRACPSSELREPNNAW